MPVRVLVSDPDDSVAFAFAQLLGRYGFEPLTATTECACVQHLCESAPDVLVIEPDTSGGWGFKLLISQISRVPPLPTIVVSRMSPDEVPLDADLTTIYHWYIKPVTGGDLTLTIREVLNLPG